MQQEAYFSNEIRNIVTLIKSMQVGIQEMGEKYKELGYRKFVNFTPLYRNRRSATE